MRHSIPDDAGSVHPQPARSRRALLAGAIGGAAAALAGGVARVSPVAAAAGDPIRMGRTNKASGTDTVLQTNSSGVALKVLQKGSGAAVRGESATGNGAYFKTSAIDRSGVRALNTATESLGGAAITAESVANMALIATSATHAGVRGNSTSFVGVQGVSASGTGVSGHSSTADGVTGRSNGAGNGVHGSSSGGPGVFGHSTNSYGIRAISGSTFGLRAEGTSGVSAIATTGWGTHSSSNSGPGVVGSSNSGIGIYGNSSTNWSGYFQIDARVENDFQVGGNASVAGSLSKGGGSFRIDHPLDPENRYLQHSFVESPEMLNVYSGTTATDASGRATITLPEWFDALNRDVRYQLTTIGDARAWVAEKVRSNTFAIATDRGNVEVCWQVTGVRKDAWAEANRIQVEVDKPDGERGTYLHPREHGQPSARGLNHAIRERASASLTATKPEE